jgi:hypothetical protein
MFRRLRPDGRSTLLVLLALTLLVAGAAGCKSGGNVSHSYPSGGGGGGP